MMHGSTTWCTHWKRCLGLDYEWCMNPRGTDCTLYSCLRFFFVKKHMCVWTKVSQLLQCWDYTIFLQIQNSLNLVETKTKAPTVLIKPLAGSWREKTWKTFAPKWKSWWTWAKDRAVSRQIRSNDDTRHAFPIVCSRPTKKKRGFGIHSSELLSAVSCFWRETTGEYIRNLAWNCHGPRNLATEVLEEVLWKIPWNQPQWWHWDQFSPEPLGEEKMRSRWKNHKMI